MDAPKFYQVEFKYERVERFIVAAFSPDDIAPSIQSPPNGVAITGFDPPTVTVVGEAPAALTAAIYLGPRHPNESYCQIISEEVFGSWAGRIALDIEGLPSVEVQRIRRYVERRRMIVQEKAQRAAYEALPIADRVHLPHAYKGTQMDDCFWCGDHRDYQIHQGVDLPVLRVEDA